MTTLPIVSKAAPFSIEVKAGKKYSWYYYGVSNNQLFCDRAHKGDSQSLKSVMFEEIKSKVIYFCDYKNGKNGVLCNYLHNKLKYSSHE